ncbi:MAG: hypothetical protein Q9174_006311 [Haloplaca sp. 1 TL-2023]
MSSSASILSTSAPFASPLPSGPISNTLTLRTPPNTKTDIWRKPPSVSDFNAPVLFRSLPAKDFRSMKVTVRGEWKTQFDQGGLIFILSPFNPERKETSWVKAGIEFFEGEAKVGVVGCDRWSDWSLSELPGNSGELEVSMEREVDKGTGEKGTSLWVYVTGPDGEKRAVREVAWVFEREEGEVQVGVYAAKPTVEKGRELEVEFKNLEINTW